jgi:hypothetical protein
MKEIFSLIESKCSWIGNEKQRLQNKMEQRGCSSVCLQGKGRINEKRNELNNTMSTPIFITGRFRSGSTLLWQLFRQLEDVVAFYEPLNDALLYHIEAGSPPQQSHVGATSYWDEYLPVLPELRKYHRIEFGLWRLFLEKNDEYPELENLIRFLINSCGSRRPVLQFNRVDFRLPWLKAHFPMAKIIHLFRNPRDQWFSVVRDLPPEKWADSDINTNYDVQLWSSSLARHFPFLAGPIRTSYERHYFMWLLSKIMGERCADVSIDFDSEIQECPEKAIAKLGKIVNISEDFSSQLISTIVPVKREGWKSFMPPKWFAEIEYRCENLLNRLGLLDGFGLKPLSAIIENRSQYWAEFSSFPEDPFLKTLLTIFAQARGEKLLFIAEVNRHLNMIVSASNEVRDNSKKIVDLHIASKQIDRTS